MKTPPMIPVKSASSQDDLAPLDGENLHKEDIAKVAEKVYQMLIRQLRLDNEREGRMQ